MRLQLEADTERINILADTAIALPPGQLDDQVARLLSRKP